MLARDEGALAQTRSVSVAQLRTVALDLLEGEAEGEALDAVSAGLIAVAVNASVTTLDGPGIDRAIARALDAGASDAQIHETLVIVSALGVHSLMIGSVRLMEQLRNRGAEIATKPLDDRRRALKDLRVGDDPYWAGMEREVPGFLDAVLRLSPETFEGFIEYCALPWNSGAVRARTKELIALAVDATPTHRFLPGMRLHLINSLGLGVGRAAILEVLDIAAAAPEHHGVP